MPWLDDVAAMIEAWYPGQEGGQAIAEILFGDVNPSGHLPITFPVNDAATMRPVLPNRGADAGAPATIDYVEGADAGYRWYAKTGAKPLFAFGHGLSYTSFAYSNLKVTGGRTIRAEFTIRNTGTRAGAAVAQLYLRFSPVGPATRLLGFERADLKPGQSRRITMTADPRLLGSFDERLRRWRLAGGAYKVSVGTSAADFVLDGTANIAESSIKP